MSTPRKVTWAAGAVLALSLLTPAHAFVVFDPTNFIENTLTAINTLNTVLNQIKQLENEAQMLENEALNLRTLDFSVLNRLRTTVATLDRLIAQAQGLAFDVGRAQQQFAQLYPTRYADTLTGDQLFADAHQRWSNSLEALRTAVSLQAQVEQNFSVDEAALADLVNRSQGAVGALQATQATNQLLALQSKQAIQEQQLRIAQDRAVAAEQARTVAAEERARVVRLQFIGGGTPYTPETVQFDH